MDTGLFSWIGRTSDEFRDAADVALKSKRERLEAIIAVPSSQRTFLNTIGALQYADDALSDITQQSDLLLSVHPDAAMREAAQAVADRIDEENVKLEFDRRLWRAVQDWEAMGEKLGAVDRKLADDVIRDMRRMGFALQDEQFEQLKQNIVELRKLQTKFEKAINDWDDAILVTRDELAGLPESYIAALSRDKDRYRVTLEYPDLFPFMRLADNDELRRQLATKNLRKGGRDNLERLARMITLRQANAALLGFPTHVDMVAEPRMAKNAATIQSFLTRIITQLVPAARREMTELIDFKKRSLNLASRSPVHFHETAYWSYKQFRELFDIDAELIKEYFPLPHVIAGMFDIYQRVLGVTFRRVQGALWHADAELYSMSDGDRLIGHFALDLHPRKAKYGHAAAFPVILGRTSTDGTVVPGFVVLVCNFPKPTPDRPSLLTHDDVETLLHEFGHVMHALLSGGRWQRQNGFGVPQDFVEALSQLFEEWAWDKRVLGQLTKHYQSGKTMPDELREKMIAARHHMDANFYLKQAVAALYDWTIHSRPVTVAVDAQELADAYRSLKLELEATEIPEDSEYPAGWSHMADYDGGYYGYLWSKVFALDMYTRFTEDPVNTQVGAAYRREVLEPGASKPELDLVRSFLGREPSDAPFLAALGLKQEVDKTSLAWYRMFRR